MKRDTSGVFRFASLQSDISREILEKHQVDTADMHTIVLLKNERVYYRSNAVLEILYDLQFPWPLFYIFKLIPRIIRDQIYRVISKNRYGWFGKRDTCRVPTAKERQWFLEDIGAGVNPKSQKASSE